MTTITVRSYSFDIAQKLIGQGISPVLARIYAARGIVDKSDLQADLSDLINPNQLLNGNQAATLLADAILKQKKMCIVADYDCDGATACAVGLLALKQMGANVSYFVPNRFLHGYGLTPQIVQELRQKEIDLIVTVDNGIASLSGVKEAVKEGMDVLITDHHLPGDELPKNCVVVNPNQPNCPFQSKSMAGVGVIFYVMLLLRAELRNRGLFDVKNQPNLAQLLDLVALGTVADLVKLDHNNRILVTQGLKRMGQNKGIAALFRSASRELNKPSTTDLAFLIAPRLNAAGRLSDMSLGVECLTTDDEGIAWEIASQLNAINQERREIESNMKDEALQMLASFKPKESQTISIYDPNWHQGIIGILASRLKDEYFRPVFVFSSDQDGLIRGSGRSVAGFHLRDALDVISKRYPDMMERFGGHAMAAGLTLRQNMFETFKVAFEEVAKETLGQMTLHRHIETDGAPDDYCYNPQFVESIRTQIWGQGFEEPIFSDTFRIVRQRVLKNKHLSLQLSKNGRLHSAIYFNHNSLLPEEIFAAFRLENNLFNGITNVQLIIEHAHARIF